METGCNYARNITGDAYAAYASITDTSGANFPAYYPRWTPPTIDAANTPWNASIAWQNGARLSGTITVSSGNCTTKGAPVPTTTHAP